LGFRLRQNAGEHGEPAAGDPVAGRDGGVEPTIGCPGERPGPCEVPSDEVDGGCAHPHGHTHGAGERGHAHERVRDRRRLLGTLALTVVMMVAEAVGGWMSGSLALLSDAGHMLTDAAALLVAALALWFAGRPADLKRTYGYFRLETLSALVNGLTLIGIAGLIGYEAFERLANPRPLNAALMLGIAVFGLLVNIGGMVLLARSRSLNVRAAFLHVAGDALSSVGVIAAGAVAWLTGWTLLDPIISVAIAAIIAVGAVGLVRQAVHVLLEAVPEHIDVVEVFGAMKAIAGVREVHDLHVWTISHSLHALSAHLVIRPENGPLDHDAVLATARGLLRERFGIDHATLQIESESFASRE
jgi:cobalt-zinc-cadmium efflux system protein